MYKVNPNQPVDLCFIGSGISSSFTLINLLEKLNQDQQHICLHIVIVEKFDEFHTGIPYGGRSGDSVLLITALKNFLPEPEYSAFVDWLSRHKTTLLEQMAKSGGPLTTQWLEKHKDNIALNRWEDIFIPRAFFGKYLKSKINSLSDHLTSEGKIKIHYIHSEVTDVEKTALGYTITGKNLKLESKKVVLGIGSLPTHKIHHKKNIQQSDRLLVINEIYKPGLDQNLKRISNFITELNSNGNPCNILIIGANASALELLYKLNDSYQADYSETTYCFLSTHGLLPDCEINYQKQAEFTPSHLEALNSKTTLTAAQIADAANNDLNAAQAIHLGAASTVGIISNAFGRLLTKLNPNELKEFACVYGNEIGRRQRCAGQHYLDIIDHLKSHGKFTHIAGRFQRLVQQKNDFYHLEYTDSKTGTITTSPLPYQVVINCIGSTNFKSDSNQLPSVLNSLISQGLATPNASQIGLEVNQRLECSENLYVVGPLLAGNIIDSKAVWHVEHCGRIIWLSKFLAQNLFSHREAETYAPPSKS